MPGSIVLLHDRRADDPECAFDRAKIIQLLVDGLQWCSLRSTSLSRLIASGDSPHGVVFPAGGTRAGGIHVTSVGVDRNDAFLEPAERRAVVQGRFPGGRHAVIALVGLLNTAVIVRQTGEAVFGLVSLVTTLSLLLPFADLGIGAVVISACSRPGQLPTTGWLWPRSSAVFAGSTWSQWC